MFIYIYMHDHTTESHTRNGRLRVLQRHDRRRQLGRAQLLSTHDYRGTSLMRNSHPRRITTGP